MGSLNQSAAIDPTVNSAALAGVGDWAAFLRASGVGKTATVSAFVVSRGGVVADRGVVAQDAYHLGGVAWPYVLSPQQTTRSSVRMAQVSSPLALIALKVPGGGEDCP